MSEFEQNQQEDDQKEHEVNLAVQAEKKPPVTPATVESNLGVFQTPEAFEFAMRKANALSKSTLVPKSYQNNPFNTMIAVEVAERVKISPLAVMQNLYIVNGNPAWSSQFIITMINNSRRYKGPLKFKLSGTGQDLTCYAYAIGQDGEEVRGITITMAMAKSEGWTTKSGSKWVTMPEQMIQYRAASFFGRLHCPDLLMGIYAEEEVQGFTEAPEQVSTDVPKLDFKKRVEK